MAIELVSVAQAKLRIRLQHTALDTDLQLMIDAGTSAVLQYLNQTEADYEDSSGGTAPDTDPRVIDAILEYVRIRSRGAAEAESFQPGYLPASVQSILYPMRTPSLA